MIPSHPQENVPNALRLTLEPPASWFVVIHHCEARVFRSAVRGTLPQRILRPTTDDFFGHAHYSKTFTFVGEQPDPSGFFNPIASALKDAGHFLILGSESETANESEIFIEWLKSNQPELFKRVIGSALIDKHPFTDAQLIAEARKFYAAPHAAALPSI